MPSLKQNEDGSMGIQGSVLDDGGFVEVSYPWDSTAVENAFFVAPRAYVVKGLSIRRTAGSADTSAILQVVKAASGTALDSQATVLHTNTILTTGTANTNATVTLGSAATCDIPAGTAIGLSFTGTTGASKGVVTLVLAPK